MTLRDIWVVCLGNYPQFLKKKVSIYLETVWKKAHLYGSDLREALIEVAYLFVSSPETDDCCQKVCYVFGPN